MNEEDRISKRLVDSLSERNKFPGIGIGQYSELARMIKLIFPFCLYNLFLINIRRPSNNADKIYPAGKGFDKVIYKSGYYEVGNEIHTQFVEKMWKTIETHIEYLRDDEYFGLTELLQS